MVGAGTALLCISLVVALSGCAQVPDDNPVTHESDEPEDPSASPRRDPSKYAASNVDNAEARRGKTRKRRPQEPPKLSLACPDSYSGNDLEPTRFSFGYDFEYFGSKKKVVFTLDYGDGKTYTAVGQDKAEAAAFWHEYTQPGQYAVSATITDDQGQSDTSTCSFAWIHEITVEQVPVRPPIYPGLGGGSGDGWLGCTYNGIDMYGAVRLVEYGGDITARIVDYGGDLKVREVDYGASSCGQWRIVEYGGDFTVRLVEYGGDITINLVRYGEGR